MDVRKDNLDFNLREQLSLFQLFMKDGERKKKVGARPKLVPLCVSAFYNEPAAP